MIPLRLSQRAYVQVWDALLRRFVQCVVCERTAAQRGYAAMAAAGWKHKLGRRGLQWTCGSCATVQAVREA
jgi:hypothetical protein